MNKNRVFTLSLCLILGAAGLWAADLSIEMQVNTSAKDYANNFLTFKGKAVNVVKDQFDEKPDAVSSASKLESTALFNIYRFDIFGGKLLPGGLRSFFLYPVADDGTRTGDGLSAAKSANGSITVRYVHRGVAYELVTDASGKLNLPVSIRTRKIGHTDNTISADFSSSGKAANVDWKKVWDTAVADGKKIGNTTSTTGKIAGDDANSTVYIWAGTLQFTLDGPILKVAGDLSAKKP
jgi:hypothetical protein